MRQLVKKTGVLIVLSILIVATSSSVMAAEKQVYTQNNIFVAQQVSRGVLTYKASYSGWVGLRPPFFMLPAGSKVTIGRSRHGFSLTTDDGKQIIFEYRRNLPFPRDEYIAKITSNKPFKLGNYSNTDRKGIQAGKPFKGMTKKGVMAALGYPPPHKVMTLKDNLWTYWKDRYRTMIIEFSNGEVVQIRE
ncbi:MAG: hypothetical protein C0624_11350 [Desulfuromonas sp.]|nr:MAG: hypothetical protein C0624_11350 [Desulfuromonas sp.]